MTPSDSSGESERPMFCGKARSAVLTVNCGGPSVGRRVMMLIVPPVAPAP